MSRVGKEPINIVKGVEVTFENSSILVKGSKEKLSLTIPSGIVVERDGETLIVTRENDLKLVRSLHGTIRVLIANMIKGVSEGFKRELEIVGVGYKTSMKGKTLILNVGFSHSVEIDTPEGLKVTTPSLTRIVVEGVDKQKVGEFAAKVRRVKRPEPYKGKGIRYFGEEVRKKVGKALAK